MTRNSAERGFFRHALDAVIAAHQRQADRYVSRMQMYGPGMLGADGWRGPDAGKRS